MTQRLKILFSSIELSIVGGLLLKFVYWVAIFTQPVHDTMAALTFLIFVDFLTGIIAAFRRNSAEKFNWTKFFWAASKLFLYNIMVITGLVLEMLIPGIPYAPIMGGFIGMWEFKSIGRNFNLIYGMDLFRAFKVWIANRNRDWTDVARDFRHERPSDDHPDKNKNE